MNSAIIAYNDGFFKLKDVFTKLGIPIGKYFLQGATKRDENRIDGSLKKSSDSAKQSRKTSRAVKKGYMDAEKEVEGGQSYSAGGSSL